MPKYSDGQEVKLGDIIVVNSPNLYVRSGMVTWIGNSDTEDSPLEIYGAAPAGTFSGDNQKVLEARLTIDGDIIFPNGAAGAIRDGKSYLAQIAYGYVSSSKLCRKI